MHTHKWGWLDGGELGTPISEWVMHCDDVNCKATLTWDEVERRLNAVEMLSREMALEFSLAQAQAALIEWERFDDALRTLGGVDVDFVWEQHLDGRPK